jgi:hypothetical protein
MWPLGQPLDDGLPGRIAQGGERGRYVRHNLPLV